MLDFVTRITLRGGLLLCAGCNFDLRVNVEGKGSDLRDAGEQVGPALDAGVDDDAGAPPALEGGAATRDAGENAPGASTADASAAARTQHPSCRGPFPAMLPPAPVVNGDVAGRPAFDFWRDIDCAQVAEYPRCQPGNQVGTSDWECGSCWFGEADGDGVCASLDVDFSCDGEGQLLSLRDGACRICAPIEAKARACCAQLPGFDCRPWPYDADSKPGQGCARHEDCEPGLVCKQGGTGYGLCLCPDVDPAQLVGDDCGTHT